MKICIEILIGSILLLLQPPAELFAQEKAIAFIGAKLIPITGPEIESGTLVVQNGKIQAVGPSDSTPIPADAEIRKFSGTIMPGLVDTHSHIGGGSGGDRSHPLQPECRILDTIDVRDTGIQKARAGGITTVNIMPGSGHLSSGQTIYLKLRKANSIEELAYRFADGAIAGGLKMANGTNSLRKAPFPGTRAKSAALVRAKFIQAQEYASKQAAAKDDATKMPPRDLSLEVINEVLAGKRIVHHHTHRHDDIVTVLRLAKEFSFRVVLHHVSEGWRVAKEIAEAKAPCSIILIDSPGGKLEAIHLIRETGKILEEAGVLTAFHTDDPITDSRLFLRSAALAVRAGMSRDAALRGLTLAGAEMIDLQDKIGSLEVGKDADFILLSADPLSVYCKLQECWVEGQKLFDRADPKDRLLAVGGFGASNGHHFQEHGCCTGGPIK